MRALEPSAATLKNCLGIMTKIARSLVREICRLYIRARWFGREHVPIALGLAAGMLLRKTRLVRFPGIYIGRYEKEFALSFANHAQEAKVVYDIGANAGYFSFVAAVQSDARIYAFEPVEALVDEIREVARVNGISERLSIEKVALTDTTGPVALITPGDDPTGVLETALQGQGEGKGKITVDGASLDDWLERTSAPLPSLMKIDVEGAELLVLAGARGTIEACRPAICIEVHGRGRATELWEWCQINSYRIVEVGTGRQILDDKWSEMFPSKWAVNSAILVSDAPE